MVTENTLIGAKRRQFWSFLHLQTEKSVQDKLDGSVKNNRVF